MPNGGPDCCGNCGFNRAVQEMAHPHPENPDRFWEISYCTLREVRIKNPFWTYCDNFRYGKTLPNPEETEEAIGWIHGSGLYEGSYRRIPWHSDVEPTVAVPCTCSQCGVQIDKGITIDHEGVVLGFCSNSHYSNWWGTQHDFVAYLKLKHPEAFPGKES